MRERFDLVSLGEVMLRLDPGERRIAQARNFSVWEGGGEYNPARAFASCFGLRSAVVTALADNPVGRLIRNLIAEGGTDSRWVRMVPFDGIGESVRNGLNFTERGFGLRAPLGCSDRGHSAASQIKADDFDWDEIFSVTDRFHTGGIFASLSDTSTQTAAAAVAAARARGVSVSFDLNYRPSLWKNRGGKEAAVSLFETFAEQADRGGLCAFDRRNGGGFSRSIVEGIEAFPQFERLRSFAPPRSDGFRSPLAVFFFRRQTDGLFPRIRTAGS